MVVVAQMGARMHYAVPAILQKADLLERLYTDTCAPRRFKPALRAAAGFGPSSLRRWLARVPAEVPADKIVSFDLMGLEYYIRRRAKVPGAITAASLWAGSELCRRAIRHGLGNATGVFTYNSAGLELMRHARRSGQFCVMEQTIASADVESRLMEDEQRGFPDWEVPRGRDPYRSAYSEREQMEWETADVILCGSEFVRESIRAGGGPVDRCRVVPYGFGPRSKPVAREKRHEPLRVLVAGSVGLRKGAPYILAAAEALAHNADFRVAGYLDITPDAQKLLSQHVTLLGPVPRPEIQRQFEWADIFLLPTLCEGSATACYEALFYGLPVITTPNAGSVVRDNIDGFLVPIRDAAAIVERVERFLDGSDLLATMSRNAIERAAEYTVEKYGERLLNVLQTAHSFAA